MKKHYLCYLAMIIPIPAVHAEFFGFDVYRISGPFLYGFHVVPITYKGAAILMLEAFISSKTRRIFGEFEG